MSDPRDAATREAWCAIWRDADIARELATGEYARSRDARARFAPFLPSGELLLEAGCGLGVEVSALSSLGHRVVGLDYVIDALGRLKAALPGSALAAGDVHALPFRDGTFGAYLSFGVLEHFVLGPVPALREAYRVLRPGGVLVVTVPAPSLVWRLARLRQRLRRQTRPFGYYETAYSASALRRFVEESGFRVLLVHPIGHSFALWGCGWPFRGPGYYETSALAERLGTLLSKVAPTETAFATLVVARKRDGE